MAKKKAAKKSNQNSQDSSATNEAAGLLTAESQFAPLDDVKKRDYHFEGWCVLRTPLMHGGDQSLGTTRLLRSQKTFCSDGKVRRLPVYSGNALRGIFRDIAAEQLLRALNVKVPPPVFHFLTSGGSLTSKGTTVDVGLARRMRDCIPMVALFGGGVGNQIMEGKLNILQGTPICRETVHVLPAYCRDAPSATLSIRDLRQIEFGVRRDDSKRENMLPMLDGVSERKEGDVATQMKYETETLAPGTCLRMGFIATGLTDAEWVAMQNVIVAWLRKPFLGGRAAAGYGEVHVPLLYRAKRLAHICDGAATKVDYDSPLAKVESVVNEDDMLAVAAEQIEAAYQDDVQARRMEMLSMLEMVG